eukprot:2505148-Rhodomonas_salina.4
MRYLSTAHPSLKRYLSTTHLYLRHEGKKNTATIRYASTAHRTAPYARSVPYIAAQHTLAQYRTSHSTIQYLSTAHRSAPYAMLVPRACT